MMESEENLSTLLGLKKTATENLGGVQTRLSIDER